MGLTLSVWLCGTTADKKPPSSSAFLTAAVPTSSRLAVMLNSSPVVPDNRRSHWSASHCSTHFLPLATKQEVTREPVEQSSDGVRAEMGVKRGLHLWEMRWDPAHRGSHAVIAITTENCLLQASGYSMLSGTDAQSWGWELSTNQLWHGGLILGKYPGERGLRRQGHFFPVPETVLVVLDADAGTLGYIVSGCFLGVAFRDLPGGVELFLAVSSVRGGSTIQLRYLNGASR
ncbi:LOW QUALITY PROTEIN: SPRY domain-containing SOCS box protein 2 [Lampris incognitus]|uniref:LOW QUALITY PROTEIN: SPRY domain-containing SOCS box protein 2 n=1 Tax=Lampris incognitus TaxID=2546036 RepID=UPI0024B5FF9A|nr:LOW QUALITY PROTEIN: SPRY domain-containing SOCS box protein 2 [Lampris incognitus]